jgi:uncharacterized protein YjbI with pentapeptide repeats
VLGDTLRGHDQTTLEEYLETVDLEAFDLKVVDLEAIDLKAVNLEGVNLESVNLVGCAMEAETLFNGLLINGAR